MGVKWDSCLAPWVLLAQGDLKVYKDSKVALGHQDLPVSLASLDQWVQLVPVDQRDPLGSLEKMVNLEEMAILAKWGSQGHRALEAFLVLLASRA